VPLVKSQFLELQVAVQPSSGSIAAPFGPSLKSQGSQVPPHPSRPRPFEPFVCGLQSCPGHAALTFLSGWLIESPRPPPPWLPPCPASLQENSLTATSRRPDSSRPRSLCTVRSDWGPNVCRGVRVLLFHLPRSIPGRFTGTPVQRPRSRPDSYARTRLHDDEVVVPTPPAMTWRYNPSSTTTTSMYVLSLHYRD